MKLEVGMYVRTKNGMKIGKIAQIHKAVNHKSWYELKNGLRVYSYEKINEPSHNIIDLIEVGDYVNGCYVEEVTKLYLGSGDYIRGVETSEPQSYGWDKAIPETWIKSIVTKEQFESMSYKVDK